MRSHLSVPAESIAECPTRCVLRVLEAAWRHNTLSSPRIAALLCLSVATIDTYFERAMRRAHVHDRGGALIVAVKCGWLNVEEPKPSVPIAAASATAQRKKRVVRKRKQKCRHLPT